VSQPIDIVQRSLPEPELLVLEAVEQIERDIVFQVRSQPDFFRKVLPGIQELPGVIAVAETWKLPPNAWAQSSDIAVFGDPDRTWQTQFELCTEGYFRTLGLPAVKGCEFRKF
jgi:hypothetical protein